MPIRKITNATLLRIGFSALLLKNVLYIFIDRAGRANDWTDFAQGAVLGVAVAAMLIVAWRKGRGERVSSCNS